MATQLFLRSLRGPQTNATKTLVDSSSAYLDDRTLSTSRGATAVTRSRNTVAGPTAGIELGNASIADRWISDPLSADVTISGTITVNLWAAENNMSANVAINLAVYRVRPDGTRTQIGISARVTEVAVTTPAVNNFTITPTSTAFLKGDRIEVAPFGDDVGTMASGFTFTLSYNGPTAAADGDSYVTFTENFSFVSPAGSTLYLTTTAAGINPGSANELEMWTSRGGGTTTSTTNTTAGPTSGVQLTDSAGGTALEWYSKPLQAVTLDGGITVNTRLWRSASSPSGAGLRVEVAIVNGDGSSPTVIADMGVAGTASVHVTNTTDSNPNHDALFGINSVSVTDGQRIRVRLYFDDQGADAPGSQTFMMSYNGTSSGAAGDSSLRFNQTLTEFVAAKGPPPVNERRNRRRVLTVAG